MLVPGCHEYQLCWAAGQNALQRVLELLETVVYGGHDDGDILRRVLWLLSLWENRLVGPVAHAMDKESHITVEPMREVSSPQGKGSNNQGPDGRERRDQAVPT